MILSFSPFDFPFFDFVTEKSLLLRCCYKKNFYYQNAAERAHYSLSIHIFLSYQNCLSLLTATTTDKTKLERVLRVFTLYSLQYVYSLMKMLPHELKYYMCDGTWYPYGQTGKQAELRSTLTHLQGQNQSPHFWDYAFPTFSKYLAEPQLINLPLSPMWLKRLLFRRNLIITHISRAPLALAPTYTAWITQTDYLDYYSAIYTFVLHFIRKHFLCGILPQTPYILIEQDSP